MRKLSLLATVLVIAGCADEPVAHLPTVATVDLDRYVGTWYEIARYPNRFQEGCVGTTATYSRMDNGQIRVVNRCRVDTLDGKEKEANGRARVVNADTNAELKVSFFRPFWGDYWIIGLDPDYRWAVVGEPRRKYLWILSREPALDPADDARIRAGLPALGYDPALLLDTLQAAGGARESPATN